MKIRGKKKLKNWPCKQNRANCDAANLDKTLSVVINGTNTSRKMHKEKPKYLVTLICLFIIIIIITAAVLPFECFISDQFDS